MELNPNHPTVELARDHWYKLAAILVARLPGKQAIITLQEINAVANKAITLTETAGGLQLRVVSMEEGEKLAKQAGGLPC